MHGTIRNSTDLGRTLSRKSLYRPQGIGIIARKDIKDPRGSRQDGPREIPLRDGGRRASACEQVDALGRIPEREPVGRFGDPGRQFLAGNCRSGYELADPAVAEAERIGKETST